MTTFPPSTERKAPKPLCPSRHIHGPGMGVLLACDLTSRHAGDHVGQCLNDRITWPRRAYVSTMGRCRSRHPDDSAPRCEHRRSHDGDHVNGALYWPDGAGGWPRDRVSVTSEYSAEEIAAIDLVRGGTSRGEYQRLVVLQFVGKSSEYEKSTRRA